MLKSRKFEKLIIATAIVALCVVLYAALKAPFFAGQKQQGKIEILDIKLASHQLYIPKIYFHELAFAVPRKPEGSVLLMASYPGLSPLTESLRTRWEKNEQPKNIMILISRKAEQVPIEDMIEPPLKSLKVFEVVGEEYGLVHQTQPKGYNQDNHDVWIERENNRKVSFIRCTEQILASDVPQCTHLFFPAPDLYFTVTYNKRLLPHWKEIHDEIIKMFGSFESRDEAVNYVQKSLSLKGVNHAIY